MCSFVIWSYHICSNKPEDEKKKIKCSVSFFDRAVTHHYPAMSPGTPPAHKVFTFSAEERARIQKVLKRSQQQEAPVVKANSPASVASSSSEEDAKDSVLMKYRQAEGSPKSDSSSPMKNRTAVISHKTGLPVATPCTPKVDLSLSPRVLLAGLTPAMWGLPKTNSPSSSSCSSLSAAVKNTPSQGFSAHESPLCQAAQKSPVKRKSPNSDVDKMASIAKSQKKSVSSGAIRNIDFSQENHVENSGCVSPKLTRDPLPSFLKRKVHSSGLSRLYETLFGFRSSSDNSSDSKTEASVSDSGSNAEEPQQLSPRRDKPSPQPSSSETGSNNSELETTPTRPASKSLSSRTPFRTLVFDSLQDSLQTGVVGKPPTMPNSAKRTASRVKNGSVSKPRTRDSQSTSALTPATSNLSITPSRSSKRRSARARQLSLNDLSESEEDIHDLNSNLIANPDANPSSSSGNNVQRQTPTNSNKTKTLSRSNGFTSLNAMQSENNKLPSRGARLECPPSPSLNSIRSSPRRPVPSSPRLPVRSSPRKSNSVPVLTDSKDVPNNNAGWSSKKKAGKEENGNDAINDAVRKMRNAVSREPSLGFSELLEGSRAPSGSSQVNKIRL